jgi:hypothetical protein
MSHGRKVNPRQENRKTPQAENLTKTQYIGQFLGIADPWASVTPDTNKATTIGTPCCPGDSFGRLKANRTGR